MGQNIPQDFHGDGTQLSPHGIVLVNYSPDWLTVYYRKRVSLGAWDSMPDGIAIGSGGIAWRVSLQKTSPISRICSDEGIWIKALDPRAEWSDAADLSGMPEQYPCEVQIQGHAWSRGVDPIDLLERIEAALGLVGVPRICGRLDLASDFSMSTGQYFHLICNASVPAVKENWVTRARYPRVQFEQGPKKLQRDDTGEPFTAAIVGSDHYTLYLGARSGMQLVIYRKDVEFEGNTGALLRDKWRQAGWIPWGENVVIRVEVRFAREWIREHKIGAVNGKEATPEMVLERAGALWRLATDQFRLAPQILGGPSQRRDRPVSEVWQVVQKSWDEWTMEDNFGAVEQTPDLSKLIETLGKRIEDARLVLSKDHFDRVMVDLLKGLPGLEDYKRNKSRWRKFKHGN